MKKSTRNKQILNKHNWRTKDNHKTARPGKRSKTDPVEKKKKNKKTKNAAKSRYTMRSGAAGSRIEKIDDIITDGKIPPMDETYTHTHR